MAGDTVNSVSAFLEASVRPFFIIWIVLWLSACSSVSQKELPASTPTLSSSVPTPLPPPMQTYESEEIGLAFDYPVEWYVHDAGKALQITPNAEPTWSSFFDPDQPHGGPAFDLLHNLNRQMGATTLAEIEMLLEGYGAEVEVLETAVPLADSPNIVMGVYRFTADEAMVLLLGAAVNPLSDSPQPVVALSGVVQADELAAMRVIFETILRSLRATETT